MGPSLRRRPHAEPDEREVMRQLLPHMHVVSCRHEFPDLSSEFRWFWSSSPHSIGEEIESSQINPSLLNEDHSIRMVRIASDAFESAMEPPMDADHLIDEVAGGTNPWQGDRYADLAPTSSSNIDRSASSQQEQLTADLIRLPLVTGIGPVAQSMAVYRCSPCISTFPFVRCYGKNLPQELRDRSANLLC